MNWISYDLKKRYCYLPELLQTVRLALLPAIYLMENVAMEELITKQRKSKEIVEEAIRCKLKILQNDGVVTSLCARPRKTGHALFLLGGQTFMCDKLYLVDQKAKEIIPKADIPSPRKEFSACAIGCKVYITGGGDQRTESQKMSGFTIPCMRSGPRLPPCWWPGLAMDQLN